MYIKISKFKFLLKFSRVFKSELLLKTCMYTYVCKSHTKHAHAYLRVIKTGHFLLAVNILHSLKCRKIFIGYSVFFFVI